MIDACFGIFALSIIAYVVVTIASARASAARLDRLRECTDELCRLDGRYTQIERSAAFGVSVEVRARMHDELIRDKDAAIERHRRAFPKIDS